MQKNKTKKKLAVPDTFVILFCLVIIICILTYLIPGGAYDELENGMVDPDSFHFVESNPATFGDFLNSFIRGMQGAAGTIFACLFIGGGFGILLSTGAVDALLATAIRKTQGNYKYIFPVVMVVMAVLGALGTGNNVAIAFVPILLVLAGKLRLDGMAIAAVVYIGSNTGFSTSPANPFTVLLAQDIAGLPQMSGGLVRTIVCICFTAIGIWYTLRYCNKIRKDPSKSITGIIAATDEDINSNDAMIRMTPAHIVNMLIVLAVFGVYAYGGVKLGWGITQLGTCMLVMGLLCGIIGRLSPNEISKRFGAGAKTMLIPSLVIGFANAINVVLSDANLLHSIVYFCTQPLMNLPTALSAAGMYIVNCIIAIPISSGSGQCYAVMPIMAPAADVLGVSRQVAIYAFQFADGFCNFITPTNGLMMGTIALCGIPYEKWLKFIGKYMLIVSVLAMIFLFFASMLGWS